MQAKKLLCRQKEEKKLLTRVSPMKKSVGVFSRSVLVFIQNEDGFGVFPKLGFSLFHIFIPGFGPHRLAVAPSFPRVSKAGTKRRFEYEHPLLRPPRNFQLRT